MTQPRYLAERLTPDFGFYLREGELLARVQSQWQHIEVFDNALFGRVMRIDGCFMTSERDEFFYHEPMVHLPAIAHPGPRSALVVGGGDGGAVEELLKHPSMERVVLAELDGAVIDMARKWLDGIHHGALDDPRVEIRLGDARALIEAGGELFDQIVLDLTDPFGPALDLYTVEFYQACRKRLASGGVLSLHLGSPIHLPQSMARIAASLREAFPIVRPYLQYVPLYGTLWCMLQHVLQKRPRALVLRVGKKVCRGCASISSPWSMKTTRVGHLAGKAHFVRDHQHGHALMASWRMVRSTSPVSSGSSAEVGSSNSMMSGSMASARAMATRCFCPPDSRAGSCPLVLAARPSPAASQPAWHDIARQAQHRHRRFDDVLQHREVRKQVEVLEHHAGLAADAAQIAFAGVAAAAGGVRAGQGLALDGDGAAVDGFEVVQAAQQRALARPRGADDGHHLAARNLQRHIAQHLQAAKALVQAACLDHELRRLAVHSDSPGAQSPR
jgi:spermidine synthase